MEGQIYFQKLENLNHVSDFDGDDENSYQRKIIYDSYNIDTSSLMSESISSQKIISPDGIYNYYNYYYFYLKMVLEKK